MYKKVAKELIDFIDKSPSCYHVIQNLSELLQAQGYEELKEEKKWNLKRGGQYFVTRNQSSIIAFKVPEGEMKNFQITASHSDSPCFKVKENPEMEVDGHYVELNTEKYGGMICAPWLDRPLSIAGRVMVCTENGIGARLVNIDRDLVLIPNVAIHMNSKLNDGYIYNAQKDMLPIFGEETAKGGFKKLLAQELSVAEEDILSTDLFLYNRMKGSFWGVAQEYISAARLDDLQCAYGTMQGFLLGGHPKSVSVCCVFDNEEVGSGTRQGAASTFLSDVLERICLCLNKDKEEYQMMLANSFLVSADNAHAVHPHHMEKADPTNRPYMNRGVVIKYNANQKYTTDSVSAAIFKKICKKAEVPVQSYVNRSDVAGGSTLGNIAIRQVSIPAVDIGLPQLAMHSPYETAGVKDTWYLIQAVKEFYSTGIFQGEQGIDFFA